jgi:hypothetical protein
VNEIITLVNVALGTGTLANCEAGDGNGDQQITINDIVTAVNNALGGCPGDQLALHKKIHPGEQQSAAWGHAVSRMRALLETGCPQPAFLCRVGSRLNQSHFGTRQRRDHQALCDASRSGGCDHEG